MELKLPDLGEGVMEGEIVKWHVKPGDAVKEDQVVLEVMTDKATVEIPTKFSGTVSELVLKEGEIAKVGQVMMRLEGAAGSKPAPAPAARLDVPQARAGRVRGRAARAAARDGGLVQGHGRRDARPALQTPAATGSGLQLLKRTRMRPG